MTDNQAMTDHQLTEWQTDNRYADARASHFDEEVRSAGGVAVDREATRAPSDGQLPPGASAADPVAALWGADRVADYRDRWRELQLRFVENPDAATSDAAALLDDAVTTLTSSLTGQKRALDAWQSGDDGDTEQMRVAMQRYRDFLDRLLGM